MPDSEFETPRQAQPADTQPPGGDPRWSALWARVLLRALPRDQRGLNVLELCTNDHRVGRVVKGRCGPLIDRYVASHPAPEGDSPRSGGIAPARLPYDDRSFDVVGGFDVLGRCSDPSAAAAEITRVARRRVVLLERNGINLLHWAASVAARDDRPRPTTPWQMLAWFRREDFTWLGVRPVPVGHGIAGRLARTAALRWQCQAVMIVGERVPALRAAA